MGCSNSIKVLEKIIDYLDSLKLAGTPYRVLNDNNLYVRQIRESETYNNSDDKYVYKESEYALTKLRNGDPDPDLTYNISIYQEMTSDTDTPLVKEEAVKEYFSIGPKIKYIVRIVVGDKDLYCSYKKLSNVKFYFEVESGSDIGTKIGYYFYEFERLCKKGCGLDLEKLKDDREALLILEDFI